MRRRSFLNRSRFRSVGVSSIDGFDVYFDSVVVDDSTDGFPDGKFFYAGQFHGLDDHGVFDELKVIFFPKFDVFVKVFFEFCHSSLLLDCYFSPKSAGVSPHRALSQCSTWILSISDAIALRKISAFLTAGFFLREAVRFSLNHVRAVRLSV